MCKTEKPLRQLSSDERLLIYKVVPSSQAGLVKTLKSAGPFTVFAPTDDAFAKLPAGAVESLLLPENKEKLVGILANFGKGIVKIRRIRLASQTNSELAAQIGWPDSSSTHRLIQPEEIKSAGPLHQIPPCAPSNPTLRLIKSQRAPDQIPPCA
jgi:hypothetical protein